MNRVTAVGLSGGVDSAYVAIKLLEEGREIIALTMYLFDVENEVGTYGPPSFIEEARQIAYELGIKHYVIDLRNEFNKEVIVPFIEQYTQGFTPNPCALCNPTVKYGALIEAAKNLGASSLATGHYADIIFDKQRQRYRLYKGQANRKDQSYLMHSLSQDQLGFIELPLSQMQSKEETRQIVLAKLPQVAHKKDSTDICFIPNGHPGDFIKQHNPLSALPGFFVDTNGVRLAEHKGFPYYTLGQRRGLSEKLNRIMYIIGFNEERNEIILDDSEEKLFRKRIKLKAVNYIPKDRAPSVLKCTVRVFQWGHDLSATVYWLEENSAEVIFDEVVRAPVCGQYAVFYRESEILGGGMICDCEGC